MCAAEQLEKKPNKLLSGFAIDVSVPAFVYEYQWKNSITPRKNSVDKCPFSAFCGVHNVLKKESGERSFVWWLVFSRETEVFLHCLCLYTCVCVCVCVCVCERSQATTWNQNRILPCHKRNIPVRAKMMIMTTICPSTNKSTSFEVLAVCGGT